MSKPKNYIKEYYKQIQSGKVIVSAKVAKLYKHLDGKLQEQSGRYVFDQERANYVI